VADFGLREVRITGFRSARELSFSPGPLCALVGEASAGKSNVLTAIWMLLDADAPGPAAEDVPREGDGAVRVEATFHGGASSSLETVPPGPARRDGLALPVLFLRAEERTGSVVARAPAAGGVARRAADLLAAALADRGAGESSATSAGALVAAIEACCGAEIHGLVVLIEEPELFLRPQQQRYLYRLLRGLAARGNQVVYSTHAPAFLNVGRLEELALVARRPRHGTAVVQPSPLPVEESFRAVGEFDAERGELFLARAALLVEGRTEKLVFPAIFKALGHDPDREAISIVECGGKSNIPLFAQICDAVHVPYLVVHDRDAPPRRRPIQAERAVNAAIAEIAGAERTIELAPDFEGVAGLRGHSHKPERAWKAFVEVEAAAVPPQLAEAVERVVALARD
jgi:predicted ATPase